MVTGGLFRLIAYGAQDNMLTSFDPIAYMHKRHTIMLLAKVNLMEEFIAINLTGDITTHIKSLILITY